MNKTSYLKFKTELEKTNKTFFSINNLKKFYQNKQKSLPVLLSAWKKNNWIQNLGQGYYAWKLSAVDYLQLANVLDNTSYISFEYALYYYNLIDQVPSVHTLATKKRSRSIKIGNQSAEYTHLKDDLFFNIELKNKIYIATPEKALIDLVYLISRGKRSVDLTTLDKDKINKNKLLKILKQFPGYTYKKAEELGLI